MYNDSISERRENDMKRVFALLIALMLLLCAASSAESGVLMCLNCSVNGETMLNIDGPVTMTAIANLTDGQSVTAWKVNGKVVEGETNFWLLFTADGNTVVEALFSDASAPAVSPTAAPSAAPASDTPAAQSTEEKFLAYGCYFQYLDGSGVGAGQTYTELPFEGSTSFRVTADSAHSSQIDYWVIDGAKYSFPNTVKFITITNLRQPMTFEVVYKNKASKTLGVFPNKGTSQVVSCSNARIRFIKGNATAGGESFKSFDFTASYYNQSSQKTCPGGTIDVKITANCEEDSYVRYWEINGARFLFNTNEQYIIVKGLGESTNYVPVTDYWINPYDGAPLDDGPVIPFEPSFPHIIN